MDLMHMMNLLQNEYKLERSGIEILFNLPSQSHAVCPPVNDQYSRENSNLYQYYIAYFIIKGT